MRRLATLLIIVGLPLLGSCSHMALQIDTDNTTNMMEYSDYIELRPSSRDISSTGIIFYPGGLVDPKAYVQSLRLISRLGYVVIILRSPVNLAILNSSQAVSVIKKYGARAAASSLPVPDSWVVAGHSLGGTAAAMLSVKKPDVFKGLIFIASYPASSSDLSSWSASVLSISASNDGLATPEKIDASRNLLPASTVYHVIDGGNHAQFGNYGVQKDDGIPTISPEDQWQEMSDTVAAFFFSRGWAP